MWPSSHSARFADVDERAPRSRASSASPVLTSRTAARASRSRSSIGLVMGRWDSGSVRAGPRRVVAQRRRAWTGRVPAGQAGPGHLHRCGRAIMRGPRWRRWPLPATASIVQRVLERVEREEGALQARRADLDAQQAPARRPAAATRARPIGPAPDVVGEHRGGRLADGAAAARERDVVDAPVLGECEHQREAVAAQRVGALVRRRPAPPACRSCAAAGSAPGSRRGTGRPWRRHRVPGPAATTGRRTRSERPGRRLVPEPSRLGRQPAPRRRRAVRRRPKMRTTLRSPAARRSRSSVDRCRR